MKTIVYTLKVELSDEYFLELANDFQMEHGFETFESLEECPNELLMMALEFFSEVYDHLNENYDLMTVTIE